ncbi:hypothetical protein LTR37_000172 [Vermiconidia calcicola]|uniref:Uncharacterized protein n=1 Tax=Vermiconidia calcicola TaxID=1690605 RepID=A0ACC3P1T6_9PEZI|nr:hypothetical protein LTR37_000172 [Vermiconidia calcicola]
MSTSPPLTKLPPELQREVFAYLTSYADLKQLCLTCKSLRDSARAILYKTIILPTHKLAHVLQSFGTENTGLQYTRVLQIRQFSGWDQYDHSKSGGHLSDILQSFPRDSLHVYDLSTLNHVPLEIIYLLHSKQRQLRNLLLHSQTLSSSIRPWLALDELRNVNKVSLHIRFMTDCERGRDIIAKISNLEDVQVTAALDAQCTSDKIVSILFSRPTSTTAPNFQLNRLQFRRFDCKSLGETLASAMDMVKLEHLALVNCWNTSVLFESLDAGQINLKSLVDERCKSPADPWACSLEYLLRRFQGLRVLRITRGMNGDQDVCSWKAMQTHGNSLRSLFVDDAADYVNLYLDGPQGGRDMADFRKLCEECPSLEQLAIQPPPAKQGLATGDFGFQSFLSCLKNLPKLTALRLITYPTTLAEDSADEDDDDEVRVARELRTEKDMQQLADYVFSALSESCPRFKALVLDARESQQALKNGDQVQKFGFLRELRTDPFNRKRVDGFVIEPHMIKHHEPCAQIFEDTVLNTW